MASAIGFIAAGGLQLLQGGPLTLRWLRPSASLRRVIPPATPCTASSLRWLRPSASLRPDCSEFVGISCTPALRWLRPSASLRPLDVWRCPRCGCGLSDGFGHRLHCGRPSVTQCTLNQFLSDGFGHRLHCGIIVPDDCPDADGTLRWLRPSASLRRRTRSDCSSRTAALRWLRPSASLRPVDRDMGCSNAPSLRWLRPSASLRPVHRVPPAGAWSCLSDGFGHRLHCGVSTYRTLTHGYASLRWLRPSASLRPAPVDR